MIGFWRFLWKELFDLYHQPITLVGLFALPLFLIFAVGQLNKTAPEIRVLLVVSEAETREADEAERILGELHQVTVIRSGTMDDIAAAMDRHDAELALLRRGDAWVVVERSGSWSMHVENLRTAYQIRWSLAEGAPWLVDALRTSQKDNSGGVVSLYALPASDSRLLVPRTLGLIIVFLPFVLACRSYVREAAYKTIPVLLSSPRGGWGVLLAGKIAVCVLLSLAVACFLLLCTQQLYDFNTKPGLLPVLLLQLLAMFTSACLGLFASMFAKNYVQAFLVVAVYFLALIMLTDLLAPLSQAAPFIQTIAHLLPLTFSNGPLNDWMFFGTPASAHGQNAAWLALQAAVTLILVAIGSYIERSRL